MFFKTVDVQLVTIRSLIGLASPPFKENQVGSEKSEKSRCYAAEDSIRFRLNVSEAGREFLPQDVDKYIEHVISQPWFKEKFRNHRKIDVKKGRRKNAKASVTICSKKKATIIIAQMHRQHGIQLAEEVCLHELAHAVTKEPGHAIDWRHNLVFIMRQQMGYRPASLLRQAFIDHELEFRDWSHENQRR